jgi:lambda family phage minor tail protein L
MTQTPPNAETLKTQLPQVIDLFTLDITTLLPAGSTEQAIYRFCNWTQVNGTDIVYQGNTYTALPLEANGFELNTKGQLARPTLTFANVGLAITALTNTYDDLVGASVQRIRTLSTYLDGLPGADPDAYWGPDEWIVEQKSNETKLAVSFQLAVPFDLEGRALPGRRLLREQCQWIYRSDIGCHYDGNRYFNADDQSVASIDNDVCGKRLSSCQLRFGRIEVLKSFTSGTLFLGYTNISPTNVVIVGDYQETTDFTVNATTGVLTSVTIADGIVLTIRFSPTAAGDRIPFGGFAGLVDSQG